MFQEHGHQKSIGYTGKIWVFNQFIEMTKEYQRWCWEPQMTKKRTPGSPIHVIHRMSQNDACNMLNSYPKNIIPARTPNSVAKGG